MTDDVLGEGQPPAPQEPPECERCDDGDSRTLRPQGDFYVHGMQEYPCSQGAARMSRGTDDLKGPTPPNHEKRKEEQVAGFEKIGKGEDASSPPSGAAQPDFQRARDAFALLEHEVAMEGSAYVHRWMSLQLGGVRDTLDAAESLLREQQQEIERLRGLLLDKLTDESQRLGLYD